jgi:2-methylcitrate dehydratase PrpD
MSIPAPTTTTSPTESFVAGLLDLARRPLPPDVVEATQRTVLNVLATAVGAAQHPSVDIVLDVGTESRGSGDVPVPARHGRHHPLTAALAIGLAAHVDDFDDTHLATVVHPGAAMLGALWPLALERGLSERFLPAFAIGVEAQLRLALAVSPWHYDDGWHITGTVGPIGAAVGAAVLLEFTLEQTLDAVGIAASSSVGIREAFGTMMKPFHPGKAAENGLLAALLAEQGVTGRRTVIEAPRGFATVLSPHGSDLSALTADLGTVWEIERNTFKPYPCGIVSHPAIDAAVEASARIGRSEDIASVRVRVHPLVPELTGNAAPRDGLQARFSTVHGVAAGLVDGRVGLAQYADERVVDAEIARVRSSVVLEPDPACARDEATLDVTLGDGSTIRAHVDHARGSLARPLTAAELASKVHDLIEPILPGAAQAVIDAVTRLGGPDGLTGIVAATTPRG